MSFRIVDMSQSLTNYRWMKNISNMFCSVRVYLLFFYSSSSHSNFKLFSLSQCFPFSFFPSRPSILFLFCSPCISLSISNQSFFALSLIERTAILRKTYCLLFNILFTQTNICLKELRNRDNVLFLPFFCASPSQGNECDYKIVIKRKYFRILDRRISHLFLFFFLREMQGYFKLLCQVHLDKRNDL